MRGAGDSGRRPGVCYREEYITRVTTSLSSPTRQSSIAMDVVRNSDYLGPVAVGLSLAVIARLAYSQLLPKPDPHLPHNPVTNLLGDVPELFRFIDGGKKNFADFIESMCAKHGPIYQLMFVRSQLVVIADRTEYERLLLRSKSVEQSSFTNAIFATVMPTSQISLPTDEVWKRHRQLTGPSMSRKYLGHMSARILTAANNLVKLWTRKVELVGNKAFDAHSDTRTAISDAILSIAIGDSPSFIDMIYTSLSPITSDEGLAQFSHSELPPLQKSSRKMMETIESMQLSPFPVTIARLFAWMAPSRRKSYRVISGFLGGKITEARAREAEFSTKQGEALATDADCVVDMIVQREAREGAEKFDDGELLDELMTYVLAGQDTTAATLSWLLKYLPLDTEVQQRLHDEVCAAFGSDQNGSIDFNTLSDSQKLPVLEAVVAETLRCAMTGPITGRELIADEVVLGRNVPKGTEILFPIAYMGLQESDWGSDAKVWRPSRWLRDDGSFDSSAGPSYPFGLGQRGCFGQRLAVLQLKVFAATLSRAFVFKPLPLELDNWDSVLKVNRAPKSCHVSLEEWPVN
ncbi:hypothetical protein FRC12_006218 [Ceratobasidium sp. 428]|nr:hypothetical protein FRC12_006218 [Ceratobasidium sp. 428]